MNMHTPQTLLRPWGLLTLLAWLCCLTPAVAADVPEWQPMLARSFRGDMKDIGITGLAVYRNTGCVFLQMEGKGVYCSGAGAGSFKPVTETWNEVCDHAQKLSDSRHRFVLTDSGIKESTDGGATWLKPIPLPRDFVVTAEAWVEYDARNDAVYLMKKGSDLYKLARGK
jgi:hypothetical protein